jgi:hypothetical protein
MKLLKPHQSYADRRLAEKRAGVVSRGDLKPGKGLKGGACNRTACQKPAKEDRDGIRWFNHSTRKYYCAGCAWELNNDAFNKRDAMELYGHDLCTLEQ